MDPITLGLIMGGSGLAKYYLADKPMADRQRAMEATKARYSPWTNIKPENVKEPNWAGNVIQFGATGAAMGANMQAQESANELNSAMKEYYQRGGGMGRANIASAGYTGKSPWSLYDKGAPAQWNKPNAFGGAGAGPDETLQSRYGV
jgi:hypothetical protein